MKRLFGCFESFVFGKREHKHKRMFTTTTITTLKTLPIGAASLIFDRLTVETLLNLARVSADCERLVWLHVYNKRITDPGFVRDVTQQAFHHGALPKRYELHGSLFYRNDDFAWLCRHVLLYRIHYPIGWLVADARCPALACIGRAEEVACENNAKERLRVILSLGNKHNQRHCGINWYAVLAAHADKRGAKACVDLLLADPCLDYNEYGCYMLHHAASSGDTGRLRILLADSRVDPSSVIDTAWSEFSDGALASAAGHGHLECMRLLLADDRFDAHDGGKPLKRALESGVAECTELLIADGRCGELPHDASAVRAAAKSGSVELMTMVLSDERADPSSDSNCAIDTACRKGDCNMLKYLMAHPRIDMKYVGAEQLETAVECNRPNCVRMLLADWRVEPCNMSGNVNEWLEVASCENKHELVCAMLESFHFDASYRGWAAYRRACLPGNEQTLQVYNNLGKVPRGAY